MNEEFEKWFKSIPEKTLKNRPIHENMLHAWHMSRVLQASSQQGVQADAKGCAVCKDDWLQGSFCNECGRDIRTA